ncbi:MAG: MG2 domain-containing protein [Bacteroidota bacterium]
MKKELRNLLYLSCILLVFSTCSKSGVQILSFTPEGEVDEYTTFQVDFNEPLAPNEKIGEWLDEKFIEFEPPVSGKSKWLTPTTLIFSPDKALKPGMDYSARVTDKVFFGQEKQGNFDSYQFHSPYFDAVKADFFWTQIPRSNFKVSVTANLHFNYEVDPKELKDYLYVEKQGKAVKNYTIVSKEPSSVIAVDFGEQQQTEKDQEFRIVVKKGLKSVESPREMTDERKFDVTLDALTRLAITSAASGHDGTKGWIEVFTTQMVDEKVLDKYIGLEPRMKFLTSVSNNSFRIEAAFPVGAQMKLTVKKGLPGMFGGKMEQDYTQTMPMADLAPKLKFADKKGEYLMRGGMENVMIEAVNVRRADVKISQVFENNLLFYLYGKNGSYYNDACCGADASAGYAGDYYEEDYYYDDYYYSNSGKVGNYGKVIYTDSVVFSDTRNKIENFTVNLSQHLDRRFKGIYVVEVRDYRDYWRRDTKAFAISNLGIIAKRSLRELTVFVNEISSTDPVAEAEVSLISTNNQTLLRGKTNSEGIVEFRDIEGKIEDFTPRLITVRKGDDFNFVDFKTTEVGLSRFDVGGKPEYSQEYDTYLYAERDLFRPGEAAHFNAIVRTKQMGIVADIPIGFKVISPRGKTFFEGKQNLGREGSAEIEVKLPTYAETGDYTMEVYSGSDELLQSMGFSVEEFVPDKIRVAANANREVLGPEDEIEIDIFSEYLFGAPCSDHAYEVDFNLRHRPFSSQAYANFNFNPQGVSNSYLKNEYRDGKLDAEGKTTLTWSAPNDINSTGVIAATAYATVYDATGRTVTQPVRFQINPNAYFVGIRSGAYYVSTGTPVPFKFVAVDSRDKPLRSFPVEVEVFRHEWRSVLTKNSSGRYFYRSERQLISEEKKKMTLNGAPSPFSFIPRRSGRYEVRVRRQGDERYTSATFYAYGSSSTTASSFEVDREGRIEIETDKLTYAPGDRAKVLFKAPFSGKMLVTLEQDRVLEHRYLDVKNNSAEFEFTVTEDHLPNLFVSATLFKAHTLEKTTPFLVGHGYQPIRVEQPANRLEVEITARERVKPRTNQEIVIRAGKEENVHVTLALVDEGILQIKNYQSPDPYPYMYANRKLSVSSYDLYKQLLDEVISTGSSVAGGDETGSQNRVNPVTAQRFKLLSYWSGTRQTNSNGEVRVSVPIPQFNGSARLMAVAWSGRRFGAAEKDMIITDDVVVLPAIPRFLSPRDSVVLPVSLMNTTSQAGKITVSVTTEGPLKVAGPKSKSVRLDGKGNENVTFGLEVGNAVGVGKIRIATEGLDRVRNDVEIAVRPTSPLVVDDGFEMLKAGGSKVIRIPGDFIASTQNTRLSISKFPAIQFAGHLSYLVRYPHGCVEQTTSKLFPQLYFADLVSAIAPNTYVNGNPVYFVNEGIQKLRSMQLSDGSLSYWQGGGYASYYGSVYAAHFLTEAKKAGFQVGDGFMNGLLNYLRNEASRKSSYNYRFYRDGQVTQEVKARKETIYALYVLALAEKPDRSLMNYYRARKHLLTGDTRYLLAGAFGLINDWIGFRDILPEAFLVERPVRESGGSFDSEVRAAGMMLNVLLEVDPNNKQIPGLIRHISSFGSRIYSTQDRAWAFLALGKAASKNANSQVKVDVLVDGKSIGTYDDEMWSVESKKLNGKAVTLKASGQGTVYAFWESEGVKQAGDAAVREIDDNIKARRKWYNRNGQVIAGNEVRQGDLIVCEISLTTGLRRVENLAVSDLLPAGFEIDNPRLGTSTALNWMKPDLSPEYLDVRDDRLLLFTSMPAKTTRKFYYMLRAVNAGTFRLAPLGCEAMYDPEFKSYHGARTIRVAKR